MIHKKSPKPPQHGFDDWEAYCIRLGANPQGQYPGTDDWEQVTCPGCLAAKPAEKETSDE